MQKLLLRSKIGELSNLILIFNFLLFLLSLTRTTKKSLFSFFISKCVFSGSLVLMGCAFVFHTVHF